MQIKLLSRVEIDTGRWDEVIACSPAETLYPYSWYLDASAENWSALVMDDYHYIMPLAWKRKFGVRYLYQPLFCQQLGVYGRQVADPPVTGRFVDALLKEFRLGVTQLNRENRFEKRGDVHLSERMNYVLPLGQDYPELSAAYAVNTKRNLKRSQGTGMEPADNIHLEELIRLKKEIGGVKKREAFYRRMQSQFDAVIRNSGGKVYGIRVRGKLESAVFMAYSRSRIIYLLSVSSEEGKKQRAMFRIVDQVIRDHAGSSLTLDFEGSDIPNIGRFFSGFGAEPEPYPSLSFSRLPFSFIKGLHYG